MDKIPSGEQTELIRIDAKHANMISVELHFNFINFSKRRLIKYLRIADNLLKRVMEIVINHAFKIDIKN